MKTKIHGVVGEKVIYNGITDYAIDEDTVTLMNDRLITGNQYEIISKCDYCCCPGRVHYVFAAVPGYYPCESFIRDVGIEYNLR